LKTTKTLNKFTPSIKSTYLLILAGLLWLSVGIMLCNFAYHWLAHYNGEYTLYIILGGFILALLFTRFKFKKFATKNIERIKAKGVKSCFFSFISWQTYIVAAIMMTMGITLRHSSIPKEYLSILYIGIGGAMFLSSFSYFYIFYSLKLKK
jgi:uncharacterized membrane protein